MGFSAFATATAAERLDPDPPHRLRRDRRRTADRGIRRASTAVQHQPQRERRDLGPDPQRLASRPCPTSTRSSSAKTAPATRRWPSTCAGRRRASSAPRRAGGAARVRVRRALPRRRAVTMRFVGRGIRSNAQRDRDGEIECTATVGGRRTAILPDLGVDANELQDSLLIETQNFAGRQLRRGREAASTAPATASCCASIPSRRISGPATSSSATRSAIPPSSTRPATTTTTSELRRLPAARHGRPDRGPRPQAGLLPGRSLASARASAAIRGRSSRPASSRASAPAGPTSTTAAWTASGSTLPACPPAGTSSRSQINPRPRHQGAQLREQRWAGGGRDSMRTRSQGSHGKNALD